MTEIFLGVQPFSKIDRILETISPEERFCLLDTNVLAAWSYRDVHTLGEDCEFIIEKICAHEAVAFASVTTRSEFLDFTRRVILTEGLSDMLLPSSPWRITRAARRKLESLKRSNADKVARGENPLYSDSQIKSLKRECFTPRVESGKDGWLAACDALLGNRLENTWREIETDIGLNYLDTQDPGIQAILHRRPEWSAVSKIITTTGISASDALILNIFQCSKIPVLVSADYDVGYAFRASGHQVSKTLLLPDQLAREVNKLRF